MYYLETNIIGLLLLTSLNFSFTEEAWKMLANLGYTQEESEQQKITQDFIKQLYLVKEPILLEGETPKFTLKWGERANIEFPKLKILEFASTVKEITFKKNEKNPNFYILFYRFTLVPWKNLEISLSKLKRRIKSDGTKKIPYNLETNLNRFYLC